MVLHQLLKALLLLAFLCACWDPCAAWGLRRRSAVPKTPILPRVKQHQKEMDAQRPTEDQTELLMFRSMDPNCPYHQIMDKQIGQLESSLPVKVRQLPCTGDRPALFKIFNSIDYLLNAERCGGFPFFYNTKSHQAICGATGMQNFRKWALGQECSMSDDLPDELLDPEFQEKQEQQEKAERGGLLGNNLMRRSGLRLQELRDKGMQAINGRRNRDESSSAQTEE